MALSLKKMREIVFQLLYSRGFEPSDGEGALSLVMKQNKITKSQIRGCQGQVEEIWAKIEELDERISKCSEAFELDRISDVEKAVLRLGIFELKWTEVPPKVVISEAVRIAKKYASAQGATFVNALLDAVYKESACGVHSEKQALI